jgi:hypothetical protein
MEEISLKGFDIKEREPFPAGDNPFLHDAFNMGIDLGSNLMAMMKNHASEKCNYVILVNKITGKRIVIYPNYEA